MDTCQQTTSGSLRIPFLLIKEQPKSTTSDTSERISVAFLTDDNAQIAGTTWAKQLLSRIPHYQIVSEAGSAHVLIVTDITTNDHKKNQAIISQFLALRRKKPMIVFLHDDPSDPMERAFARSTAGLLLLRTSLNRSTMRSYEQLLPSFQ